MYNSSVPYDLWLTAGAIEERQRNFDSVSNMQAAALLEGDCESAPWQNGRQLVLESLDRHFDRAAYVGMENSDR